MKSTGRFDDTKFRIENESRRTLAQIIGLATISLTIFSTLSQVNRSSSDSRAKLLSDAIQQLASLSPVARISGAFVLGSPIEQSTDQARAILSILCELLTTSPSAPSQSSVSGSISEKNALLTAFSNQRRRLNDTAEIPLNLCNLSSANFVGVWGEALSFSGVRALEANFSKSYLVKADFTNAVLEGANFNDANLTGADFTGAKLAKASFDRAVGLNPAIVGD